MLHAVRKPQTAALIALVTAGWILWNGASHSKSTQHVTAPVPLQLGLWTGTPLSVSQRTVEILETEDVNLMEYHLGNEPPLWFAQVAGFGTRAAFHPPELCYVGSHYEVLERSRMTIFVNGSPRQLMRLVLSQGADRFESWYWFTASDRTTPNYYQQQLWLVMDSIRHKPMSGMLVRISTPLDNPQRAERRLLAFVTAWDAMHQPNLRNA